MINVIPKGEQAHLGNWHVMEREDGSLYVHAWPADDLTVKHEAAKDARMLIVSRIYPAPTPSAQRSADLCGND